MLELPNLIKIPSIIGLVENLKVKLHVFVHLNESNVSARGENHDQGQVIAVTLIRAKTRVTPKKKESVSCLELAACVRDTRLGLTVANAIDIAKSTITFWTDSTNCLNWKNSPLSALKFLLLIGLEKSVRIAKLIMQDKLSNFGGQLRS